MVKSDLRLCEIRSTRIQKKRLWQTVKTVSCKRFFVFYVKGLRTTEDPAEQREEQVKNKIHADDAGAGLEREEVGEDNAAEEADEGDENRQNHHALKAAADLHGGEGWKDDEGGD